MLHRTGVWGYKATTCIQFARLNSTVLYVDLHVNEGMSCVLHARPYYGTVHVWASCVGALLLYTSCLYMGACPHASLACDTTHMHAGVPGSRCACAHSAGAAL